jgi:hypothetical protein
VFGDEPHQPPSELLQLLCEEYYNTLYIDVRRARYYWGTTALSSTIPTVLANCGMLLAES